MYICNVCMYVYSIYYVVVVVVHNNNENLSSLSIFLWYQLQIMALLHLSLPPPFASVSASDSAWLRPLPPHPSSYHHTVPDILSVSSAYKLSGPDHDPHKPQKKSSVDDNAIDFDVPAPGPQDGPFITLPSKWLSVLMPLPVFLFSFPFLLFVFF